MTGSEVTFLSHTAKPGGAELSLRRYLLATDLPVGLVTMAQGEVWGDLSCPVTYAPTLRQVGSALRRGSGPVVANSMRTALYAALVAPRGRPVVYWVRDGLTDSAMSKTALWLTRHVTARRVTAYLANSEWTAGTVRQTLGIPAGNVHVVQSMCGVGMARGTSKPRPRPAPPYRLLYLGRLAPWKAPHVAVDALTLLRSQGVKATLSIAGEAHFGEDDYAQELKKRVAASPGVTMLGHVDDVSSLLACHDLAVHCSTRPEPFGQVIVQSLAAGVPVVATDGGGPAEILQGAPADVLYRAGEPAALVSAIQRALTAHHRLSQWALIRVQDYTDVSAKERTDAVLEAMLEQDARCRTTPRNRS